LGYGRPASFWEIQSRSLPDALYPQALVRQILSTQGSALELSQLRQFDIEMMFNTELPFFFPRDILEQSAFGNLYRDIKSDEYDLLYLSLHELVHGLGMVTFFSQHMKHSSSALSSQFPIFASTDMSNMLTTPIISPGPQSRFAKLGIFDHSLTTPSGSFSGLMKISANIFDNNASVDDQLAGLQAARILYLQSTTARGVSSVFSSSQLQIESRGYEEKPPGLYVYTSVAQYEAASSLVHAETSIYSTTEDFLICPTVVAGSALEMLLAKFGGKFGPVGKRTIAILSTMGYRLHDQVAQDVRRELSNNASYIQMESVCIFIVVLTILINIS
jgi:hypothetical protein